MALIGEHGLDGAPTATRIVITVTYALDQELARDGALPGLLPTLAPTLTPTPMPTLPPLSQLDVQVVSVETVPGHIAVRLRMFNGQTQSVRIDPDTIWLALGYTPEPSGPRVPVERLTPFDLLSGQAVDLTLNWAWAGEPYGSLGVGSYRYDIGLRTQ